MATVQSLMWEIYKMHPYHIKEIKNQPRLKIFNLTLILTCNIHIQRILLGNCVRVRFFCTHDLLTYQKSKEWDFWYKNNDSVNTDHSTFYVALFTIYIPRLSSFCQHFTLIYVSNVLVNWVISIFCGQAATRGEMWHGRQQHRRSRIISKNYHEDKDVMR